MVKEQINQTQRRRFKRLMWPWIPTVLRFAKFLTRDEHAAEDLAQETMMRALRNIDNFEEGTDAKAWLLTVERRLFLDHVRAQKHAPLASLNSEEGPELAATTENPLAGVFDEQWEEPEDLMRRFTDQELIDALAALPDETRWVLLLVDVEELQHSAAAEVLGVSMGTVKSRASRGRAMLRDRLYQRAVARGWADAGERETA